MQSADLDDIFNLSGLPILKQIKIILIYQYKISNKFQIKTNFNNTYILSDVKKTNRDFTHPYYQNYLYPKARTNIEIKKI